jgi:hypothetical protein
VELYTAPPPGSTVICADELGPVIPRTFAPAPGWSPDGHRIKAPLEYSRGPEKTWVYGGLRVADGHAVTMCASSRNSAFYQDFLQLEEQANPKGTIWVITDNLSSHDSKSTRAWLEDHPRIRHAFIPKGACWLNFQEGWWRIFRRFAGLGGVNVVPAGRGFGGVVLGLPDVAEVVALGDGDDYGQYGGLPCRGGGAAAGLPMIITVNATVCVIGTRVSDQRFMIIYSDPGREVHRG